MPDFQKISKGFFWNHVGRVSEYLLIYLFTVVIARSLGAIVNGYYATFLSITQLLLILSSLGLETAITSRLPQVSSDKSIRSKILINLLLIRLILVMIVGLVFLFLWDKISILLNIPYEISNYLIIVLFYFGFRSIITLLAIFFIVNYETKKISVANVSMRIVDIIGAYLIIQLGLGLREILVFISSTALINIIVYIYLLRDIIFYKQGEPLDLANSFRTQKYFISFGSIIWVIGLFDFFLSKQADIFLLNYFTGNSEIVGHYDVATSFGQVINFGLTTGMFGISIVSFSSLTKSNSSIVPAYCEFLSRMVVLVITPAFIFAIWFADKLIPLLYSGVYTPSIILFQVFAVFLLVTRILSGGVTGDYLQSVAKLKVLLTASIIGGGVNIILAVIMIPKYGAIGAIYSTGIGLLTITLIHGFYVLKSLKISFSITFSFKLIFGSLISILFTIIIQQIIHLDNIIFDIIIYCIMFWLLLVLFKPLKYEELKYFGALSTWTHRVINSIVKLPDKLSALTDRQKWAFAWMPNSEVTVDIGSGITPLSKVINEKSNTVFAVDTDNEALQKVKMINPEINILSESASQLSLKSESCDTVLLLDVLEHVEDESNVIDGIYRILKPSGTLIISVPHKGLFSFLDPLNVKNKDKQIIHSHYSEKDLWDLFGNRFKLKRIHFGGLFLYPLTFAGNNFFKKHFNLKWDRFFKRLGDWDNNISWGKLSYNLIMMVEKTS